MWCSAVAQGLREAVASTFLLLLHVYVFTEVCVVFRIPTGITVGIHLNFSSGIKVSLPLSVLAISLLYVWPSAPVVHNPTLSQLPKLPISSREYSHSWVSETWQPSIQCNLQYPVTQWMMVVSAFSLLCLHKAATKRVWEEQGLHPTLALVLGSCGGFTAFINAANSIAKPSGLSRAIYVIWKQ